MKRHISRFVNTPPIRYYQRLKARWQRKKAKPRIKKYLQQTEVPRLNIGCGSNVLKGWLNTDIYPVPSPIAEVVYLDASLRFPFEDASFQFVNSEHIFEHLTFEDSCNMLAECYRVLRPGGIMRMAIPYFDFLLDLYKNPEGQVNKEYIAYSMENFVPGISKTLGNTSSAHIYVINNFYRDWGHEVIHDFSSLKELVEQFNFKEVERKEVGQSDFELLQNIEGHARTHYPIEFYNNQTLVIEARK